MVSRRNKIYYETLFSLLLVPKPVLILLPVALSLFPDPIPPNEDDNLVTS